MLPETFFPDINRHLVLEKATDLFIQLRRLGHFKRLRLRVAPFSIRLTSRHHQTYLTKPQSYDTFGCLT